MARYAGGMTFVTTSAILAAALLAQPSPSPSPSPSAPPTAKDIVDRAIQARGGEGVLGRATVLAWRGRAIVPAAGGGTTTIVGRWIVEPPDRAVVVAPEAGKDRAALTTAPDRLYLFSLLRTLPLRDPGTTLTVTGPRSLRVERQGRPAVEMFFDGTGWLDRVRTEVRDTATGASIVEEATFAGEVVARGLRWPRRINISRDGEPVFDLEIEELRLATPADLTREMERRP